MIAAVTSSGEFVLLSNLVSPFRLFCFVMRVGTFCWFGGAGL
jgi:hypothetical protein